MINRIFSLFIMIVLIVAMSALNLFADEVVVLKDGTPVVLRLTEEISTKTKNVNDIVNFEVVRDIPINGKTVIKAGTPAEGMITLCTKPDILGQEGTIGFRVSSTKTVDGQWVSLRANLSRSGQNKELLSAGAAYACCIVFGLIKGESATFPVGTEIKAYTENDLQVKID